MKSSIMTSRWGRPQHAALFLGRPQHAALFLGRPQHAAPFLGRPQHAALFLGRPQHAALFLIGAICSSCSSDATNETASMPNTPGSPATSAGMTTTPPATPATPAPAMTGSGPSGNASGSAAAPSSEGSAPANVDTSMLDDMPGSSGPAGSNSGAGNGAGMGSAGTGGDSMEMPPAAGAGGAPEPPPAGDCVSPALAPGDSTRTVQVGNVQRSYVLHVPNTYTGQTAVPLLFDFHGLGGNGQGQRNSSSFVAATQSEGVILAFPSGTSDGSGNGWNVGTCCASGDDVGFTRAMVTQIQSLACIDRQRIYATGFSNGGGMSYKLACDAADIIAAVAPASFDLAEDNVDACNPSRPISVVAQRGTNDFAVPFEGGATPVTNRIVFIGAQATFDKWNELNGCTGAEQAIGNNCTTVSQCNAGVEDTLCVIQGGGHQPGNANLLWPILREFTLP